MKNSEIKANLKQISLLQEKYKKLMTAAFKSNFFENVNKANAINCEIYILNKKNKFLKKGLPPNGVGDNEYSILEF